MKKNLFYAAFALAMMASCTNEDNLVVDPANPTPDAEDKVALTLGIDAPAVNATVGARGTGSVGDVQGENNKWNSQQLYITMIDRKTGDVALNDDEKAIMDWDSYTYVAPRKSEQATQDTWGKGNIRIYEEYEPKEPTTAGQPTEDNGILQYLYYPTQGKFDFYGWHLDDASAKDPVVTATPESTADAGDGNASIKIANITIDGTQDIMGAQTKDADATTYGNAWTTAMEGWAFSARTARNDIDPILAFEHKLARVKFFVKAGSESAALHDNSGNLKTAKGKLENQLDDPTSTGAMYITAIKGQNMHSTFDMTLSQAGIVTDNAGTPIEFTLMDEIDATTGKLGTLKPKAPNYKKDYKNIPENETDFTQVGHAMMFLPVADLTAKSLTFHIDMKQYVQLKEDETDGTPETGSGDEWGYEERKAVPVTVNATDVRLDGSTVTAFEAGKSYNVYITIYGFERIEVSAELTPWVFGGDVDVDIEEGNSNPGAGTQTPTQKTTVTFNITNLPQDATATIELSNGTSITYPTETTVEVDQNSTTTYTITAEGFKTFNGEIETTETTGATHDESATLEVEEQPAAGTVAVTFKATYTPEQGEETVAQSPTIVVWEGTEDYLDGTSTKVEATEGAYNLSKDKTYSYTVTYKTGEPVVTYKATGTIEDLASVQETTKEISVTLEKEQP